MVRPPLSLMVVYWYDLDIVQRETIQKSREMEAFRMKGISNETDMMFFIQYYDDVLILPETENIPFVQKVEDNPNYKLEIMASAESQSSSLCFVPAATAPINSGARVRVVRSSIS